MAEIIEDADLRNKNYVFRDRFHAGELLAEKIGFHKEYLRNPIILAIPAGGVPVGAVIAKRLSLPMDMTIVRKLPIPLNPEAGFGSVSWDGEVTINRELARELQLSEQQIESIIARVRTDIDRRMAKFRGKKAFPDLRGRSVIIVDDGLASGYTMLSAIGSIRKYSPHEVTVAVPTASRNAIELVASRTNYLFCLNIRETIQFAVADAYQEWHDLTDQEVILIIKDMF
ncbi:MAG TPA: phosphoribosyltransferase family protein [Candidatus Methanoperedens sp.]